MPIYRRHASKTAEWSGRELVPSPLAAESDSEVWFALPREGEGDQIWEALNGRLTETGLVEVRAAPALAYGVAFGDRVSVIRSAEGPLLVNEICERGSFGAFRIWLGEDEALAARWKSVAEKYAELGCLIDVYSEKLVALACPQDRVTSVRDALESQASESGLIWEESSFPQSAR
ncbi:DUF4265 domain-containing protein [Herbiconiux daphne]|uniref:DUF4265 domain-containing protein n=1 Tax=Herbiconiux daphne TaxID=2970914 RepID=A0ABT2GZ23_9MICO|nr:DUF4265 domain-containing protein [Herbiconiux daphne]MCS5732310.1 DUF4265 domain-containing protein [Herbiconiux daphne]